jgi:oligopeptide/dipeptide ABC transporter ATP-binding protein
MAQDAQGPILAVRDLRVYFSRGADAARAVDGVSFELRRGETLALVGESGSGKTLTGLALMGLLPRGASVAGGHADFDGTDLLAADEATLRRLRGRRLAMIFQDPLSALNPYLTVGRQITEATELHLGLSRRAAREQAVEMLSSVGIADAARRSHDYPHQFSGGMRQRVMIAMALACDPALLIADEPTTALDVTVQAQILDLLAHLRERSQTSVILITHDLGVVAGTADRVAVMYAGRVVEQAPVAELFAAPRHPYTVGLLESLPSLEGERGELRQIPGSPPDPREVRRGCAFAPRCSEALERCAVEAPPCVTLGGAHSADCWAVKEAVASDR